MRARRALAALVVAAALAGAAGQGGAHQPSRVTAREFVRLAGSFAAAPSVTGKGRHDILLSVQGRERRFVASEWQVFALVSEDAKDQPQPAPERLTLQGTREDLARIAAARPEQRVALLGERRPGSAEVFVLAADLCPPD